MKKILLLVLFSNFLYSQVKTKEQLYDDYARNAQNDKNDLAAVDINLANLLYGSDNDTKGKMISVAYLIIKENNNFTSKSYNDTFLAVVEKFSNELTDADKKAKLNYIKADFIYNILRSNYGSKDYPSSDMTKMKNQAIIDAKAALNFMDGNELLNYIISDLEKQTLY